MTERLVLQTKRTTLFWAGVVFAAALLARLCFIEFVPVKPIESGDQRVYKETAVHILHEGKAYSQEGYAFRPPLFPYFLALVYSISEKSDRAIMMAQALLGALSAVLLFLILGFAGTAAAVIGAFLFSFHPLMLFFTKQVMIETLYIFLLLILVYLVFTTLNKKRMFWAVLTGLLMGLTILCRSESGLLSGFIILGILIFYEGPVKRKLAAALAVLCFAGMAVSPWLIRNYMILGSPVLSTSGGKAFYGSTHPQCQGTYFVPDETLNDLPDGEIEKNTYYLKKGIQNILDNPWWIVRLALKKQKHLWKPFGNPVLDAADLMLLPFILLGFAIAWLDRKNWNYFYFLAIPILSTFIVFLVFGAIQRYRTLLYPFFFCFSALAIWFLLKRITPSTWELPSHSARNNFL